MESWKQACGTELELIVHVGHTCTEDARALAAHAESLKVDGIAAIGPCFFGVNNPRVLSEYCAQIAAAAPQTPFYYYHFPSMSRVTCKASEALDPMRAAIPTFAGVKFTHDDLDDYRRCIAWAGNRYEIFFGRDELLLEAMKAGARSAVGSTYNFAAPLYLQVAEAFAAGELDRAQRLQNRATETIVVMARAGGLPSIQAAMKLAGFDCGSMRLPLRALDAAACAQLGLELEKMGYLNPGVITIKK